METKTVVVTQKGMRLDEIVFKEYGHLEYFENILELNIKTLMHKKWLGAWSKEEWIKNNCSVHLDVGTKLMLPIEESCSSNTKEVEASKLW